MEAIQGVIHWVQANWISVMGILWGVDQILKVVAPLTKSKWDDNLSDMLGKWLAGKAGIKSP